MLIGPYNLCFKDYDVVVSNQYNTRR